MSTIYATIPETYHKRIKQDAGKEYKTDNSIIREIIIAHYDSRDHIGLSLKSCKRGRSRR